jgi:hypothetical protein
MRLICLIDAAHEEIFDAQSGKAIRPTVKDATLRRIFLQAAYRWKQK